MNLPSPPVHPIDAEPALKAWNMMGGMIDWSALPVICEILGVEDVEMFILHLTVIRDDRK